jgi:hypothetical protein
MAKQARNTPDHNSKEDLQRDLALLKELGFKKRTIQSLPLNIRKIENFRMRQLDRLKLFLLRNEHLIGGYPSKIRIGIVGNDSCCFAQALVLLSSKLRDMMG